MEIIKKKLSDLIPASYNPRKDLQPQDPEYLMIKNSIEKHGFVQPIVWNKRTNHIVDIMM